MNSFYTSANDKQIRKQKNIHTHWMYTFANFVKTPSNFIPILLYVIYIASILLIIPKVLLTNPLYVWNNSNFDMKIFNLSFIALICGAAASNIFCIRKNDTVQLVIFSKPIPRRWIFLNKIFFYFMVILCFTLLIVGIAATTVLIFGWYDPIKNINGIKFNDYLSLLISLLVGNGICCFIFIAIGILIGMKHGTTITMVASLLIASTLNLFNFIIPFITTKSSDYLENKYGTSIESYTINTLEQYQNNDSLENDSLNVCTLWSNEENLNPIEIQKEVDSHCNEKIFNYFNIGDQLSKLFHCFASDEAIEYAKKISSFGDDFKTYKYTINDHNIFQSSKTPLFFYDLTTTQGLEIPTIYLLGLNLNDSTQQALEINNTTPNFVSIISKSFSSIYSNDRNAINDILNKFEYCFLSIDNLKQHLIDKNTESNLMPFLQTVVNIIIEDEIKAQQNNDKFNWQEFIWKILSKESLDTFENEKSPDREQFKQLRQLLFGNASYGIENANNKDCLFAIGEFQLSFFVNLMQRQIENIKVFFDNEPNISFPYTSTQIRDFFNANKDLNSESYIIKTMLSKLVTTPIPLMKQQKDISSQQNFYLCLPYNKLSYCESLNQMYEYKTDFFFPTNSLIIIWSTISFLMVIIALCIYWRIDYV